MLTRQCQCRARFEANEWLRSQPSSSAAFSRFMMLLKRSKETYPWTPSFHSDGRRARIVRNAHLCAAKFRSSQPQSPHSSLERHLRDANWAEKYLCKAFAAANTVRAQSVAKTNLFEAVQDIANDIGGVQREEARTNQPAQTCSNADI